LGLEVASLGSGSSGNATLVRSETTTLLIDCGFTLKESLARMATLGVAPSDLTAVLISHEHSDHVKGIGPMSRKFGVPIWLTHGTFGRLRDNRLIAYELFHAHASFTLGDIEVDPFPTPHDAAESCQYIFTHNDVRFACVTDLGACTPHVIEKLEGAITTIICFEQVPTHQACSIESDRTSGTWVTNKQVRLCERLITRRWK